MLVNVNLETQSSNSAISSVRSTYNFTHFHLCWTTAFLVEKEIQKIGLMCVEAEMERYERSVDNKRRRMLWGGFFLALAPFGGMGRTPTTVHRYGVPRVLSDPLPQKIINQPHHVWSWQKLGESHEMGIRFLLQLLLQVSCCRSREFDLYPRLLEKRLKTGGSRANRINNSKLSGHQELTLK